MPLDVLRVEPLEVAVVGIFVRPEPDTCVDVAQTRHWRRLKNLRELILPAPRNEVQKLIKLIAQHLPHAKFKTLRVNAFVQRIGFPYRLLKFPGLQTLSQL